MVCSELTLYCISHLRLKLYLMATDSRYQFNPRWLTKLVGSFLVIILQLKTVHAHLYLSGIYSESAICTLLRPYSYLPLFLCLFWVLYPLFHFLLFSISIFLSSPILLFIAFLSISVLEIIIHTFTFNTAYRTAETKTLIPVV